MRAQPRCVVVAGRPGAGKTTLSRVLGDLLHLPVLSRDRIKEGYVGSFGISQDKLPADTSRKVTDLFFSVAQSLLEADVSLVVEAAFQHRLWEEAVPGWSDLSLVYVLICEADPTSCAQRHLERGLSDPSREFYHDDRRVRVFRETGQIVAPGDYDPPSFDVPTLRVDTTDGYSPAIGEIRDFVMEGASQ